MTIEAAAQTHLIAIPTEVAPSRRLWIAAVCVLFLLHLGLASQLPQQGWITCVGVGCSYAIAALFSVCKAIHSEGILRAKWGMLAAAFVIRIGRDLAILYGAYVLRIEPDRAWVHSALSLLTGVPMLFVLSSTDEDDEPQAFAWLDGAQLLLITALFLFDVFPGASIGGDPGWAGISIHDYVHLRDFECFCLILLAAARAYAAVSGSIRRFYVNLLALALLVEGVNLLNDYAIDHFNVQAASPIFALTDLPPLVFVILWVAGIRLDSATAGKLRGQWVSSMIRLCSPVFFALAVLLLSVQAMNGPFHAGVWASCAGLSLYGVRSAFVQLRQRHTQSQLIVAQSELLEKSQKDPLTDLYNRRWFDDTQRVEWSLAVRARQPISLLMIDIDNFKEFNDTAGHKAGDRCLVAVAAALRKKLQRDGDSISRYGGEEFAVILPVTDAAGALIVAERLRQAVAAMQIVHPGISRQFVTVSVGVATLAPVDEASSSDELFLMADAALYQAKQRGRNRVEVA